MKKYIIAISIFAILVGCSGGFGTMDRIMQSWNGASLEEVIAQWGYPTFQQDIAGRKLYHWDKEMSVMMPATTTGSISVIGSTAHLNSTTFGGGMFHGSCRRTLEVNNDNIIVGSQWSGNNCPFADVAMGYQNWQRKPVK